MHSKIKKKKKSYKNIRIGKSKKGGFFQTFQQSFSALKRFDCALARAQPENLRSRSMFASPCAHARAQNV